MQLPSEFGIRRGWLSAVAVLALFAVVQPASAAPIALSSLTLNGAAGLVSVDPLLPDRLRLVPNFDTNVGNEKPPAGSACTPSI